MWDGPLQTRCTYGWSFDAVHLMSGFCSAEQTWECHAGSRLARISLCCVLFHALRCGATPVRCLVLCSCCVEMVHCVTELCRAVLWLQAVVTTVARLYQQYSIELEPGQVPLQVKQTFALVPAQGLRVRLHKR